MHYVGNIEEETLANENFRKVLFTDSNLQLVVMSLLPSEEIEEEVHELDQFIRIEKGEGKAILDGKEFLLKDGSVVMIPKGTRHTIVNMSATGPLKLYTLYAPPEHPDKTVHKTKADALQDENDHVH